MLPAGRGRGIWGQIGTTGTSGNGDSDVMLLVGRGRGLCGQISTLHCRHIQEGGSDVTCPAGRGAWFER